MPMKGAVQRLPTTRLYAFILLALLFRACPTSGGKQDKQCSGGHVPSDFLVLAQQWPRGLCLDQSCAIDPTIVDRFTIHGLWPSHTDGSYPCFCNAVPSHTLRTTVDLLQADAGMRASWPSIYGNPTSFWSHEFRKHGSCMAEINSPMEYFGLAQQLFYSHNVLDAFSKQSIDLFKTDGYPAVHLERALSRQFGARVIVQCGGTQHNVLRQLLFCFHPHGSTAGSAASLSADRLEVMNCPSSMRHSCRRKGLVSFGTPSAAAQGNMGESATGVQPSGTAATNVSWLEWLSQVWAAVTPAPQPSSLSTGTVRPAEL